MKLFPAQKPQLNKQQVTGLVGNHIAFLDDGSIEKRYLPENVMNGILKHKDSPTDKIATAIWEERVISEWSKQQSEKAKSLLSKEPLSSKNTAQEIESLSLDTPEGIAKFIIEQRKTTKQMLATMENYTDKASKKSEHSEFERILGTYLAAKYWGELNQTTVSKKELPQKFLNETHSSMQTIGIHVTDKDKDHGTLHSFYQGVRYSDTYQRAPYLTQMHDAACSLDKRSDTVKKDLTKKFKEEYQPPDLTTLENYTDKDGTLEGYKQKQMDINEDIIKQETDKESKDKQELKKLVSLSTDITRLQSQIKQLQREERVILRQPESNQSSYLYEQIHEQAGELNKLNQESSDYKKQAEAVEEEIKSLIEKLKQKNSDLGIITENKINKQNELTQKQRELQSIPENKEHNKKAEELIKTIAPKLVPQYYQLDLLEKEKRKAQSIIYAKNRLEQLKKDLDDAKNPMTIEDYNREFDQLQQTINQHNKTTDTINKLTWERRLSQIAKTLENCKDPEQIKELKDEANQLTENLEMINETNYTLKSVQELSEVNQIIDNMELIPIPQNLEFDQASQDHESPHDSAVQNFKDLVQGINENIGKLKNLQKRMEKNPSLADVHSDEAKRLTRDLDAKMTAVKRMLPTWGLRYFSLRNVSLNPTSFNLLPSMQKEGVLSREILQTMPEVQQLIQGLQAIDNALHGSANKQYDNKLDRKLGETLPTWMSDCTLDAPTYDATLEEKMIKSLGKIKWKEYLPQERAGLEHGSLNFFDYFATTREHTIEHGEELTGKDILAVFHDFNNKLVKEGKKPGQITRWSPFKRWWKGSDGFTISFPDDRGHEGHQKLKEFAGKLQECANKVHESKENTKNEDNDKTISLTSKTQ